jgi:calcyclin binding protein
MSGHFGSFCKMDPNAGDIRELKRLLAITTTPYVESFLRSEITRLSALFPEDPEPPAPAPPKPSPPRKLYESIDAYAFSDAKDTARVIITDIAGLSGATIDFTPTERAFTITVSREAQGLPDLRLTVSPLKKIVPGESRYNIKGKTITIVLKKKKSNTWTKLKKTASSIKKPKPGEKAETKEDPSAGLMDMMRKMYEEGDDEMKRTMQKAWWEAQHKKDEEKKGKSDD